jgi:hypothetical protein
MTVRTWFTISALVLVALAAAVALQFTRPLRPPEILVRSGNVRLHGMQTSSAWPQRDGRLARSSNDSRAGLRPVDVPGSGTFRFVFASPAQPTSGEITITNTRHRTLIRTRWHRAVRYDLPPGAYVIRAVAGDRARAYVAYEFAFRVTRTAS